jgi:hypothetical protein
MMLLQIAMILFLVGSAVDFPPCILFTVTDLTSNEEVLCIPLRAGEPVTLVYTHSMYGGDVEETLVPLSDGRLRRVEMTTANVAAAEYYAYDAPVEPDGKRYRVVVPPADYDAIVVRVDTVGRHRLIVRDEVIDLVPLAGGRHQVRFDASRLTAIGWLAGRAC